MNTMTPKEHKEAMELVQAQTEISCACLIQQLKEKYPLINCSGRVIGATIRVEMLVAKGEPRLAEIAQACQEMEDDISYPEIRFIVREIDSETK